MAILIPPHWQDHDPLSSEQMKVFGPFMPLAGMQVHRMVALLVGSPRAGFQEVLPGHQPGQTAVCVEDRNTAGVGVGHAIDRLPTVYPTWPDTTLAASSRYGLRPVQTLAAADPAEDIGPARQCRAPGRLRPPPDSSCGDARQPGRTG